MRRLTVMFMASAVAAQSADLSSYVLTDTGTVAGGNAFPGVSRPLGMVKIGPDLENGVDAYSGYLPDGHFIGFSMLHEHGTGGAPKYGVVNQMPVVGAVDNPLTRNTDTRAQPDETEVGHYKSFLSSGVVVELGATERAGLYQYSFPGNGSTQGNVIVDVSHVLPSYRGQGLGQNYLGGKIEVVEADDGLHYEGHGYYDNGWNRAEEWQVFFCGYFDRPAAYKTFLGVDRMSTSLAKYGNETSHESRTQRLGAIFTFEDATVRSRVGVSFISTTQACKNVNSEIPADRSFSSVRRATREAWNSKVLSKVKTTETETRKLNQLYSALYFMNLLPTNKTGENPLWKSSEPYYDDVFTFWDTFRCTTSLLHILQPEAYEEFIRSMIDIWRHEGYVSDARSSFYNGAVQAGSNSDNVLADAYVKGVRGAVNWDDGLLAMLKNGEVTPPPNNDPRDRSGSTKEGRGALPDWLDLGWISPRFARAVTRAVEYSVNDFNIYQVAKGLGVSDVAKRYLKRSRNWRNHWNKDMTSHGFSGFMGPRNADGSFPPQDPLNCGGCYWAEAYYQATPWEYSFNAHHDVAHLVNLTGGAQRFSDRLEKTFEPGQFAGNGAFGNTIFNPGNEPSFGTPYLFNFVNKQHLSVERSRFVAKSYYKPAPNGLPGNSDAGAMESWLLWNMIGLYPLTGQTTFLIGSPWFSDLTISLGDGRELKVSSTGGSEDAYYVQSLRVNGKQWDKAWVTWGDIFANGGTLEFELGFAPKEWATGDLPPSPASAEDEEEAEVAALRQQPQRRMVQDEQKTIG
ncbi:Glycosyl hydrolase family 92 [Colletotrichum higginsianum IMI 349063]|uniref:Glycosyl hydrolase family 92 n=1 Tax=Colletotrichum higginsianum (strain IMI 349063) TaxID=759273 RepID=A0A1B7YAG2_COLHI|nr:Glycosyl hydrolase family 92 [Colletotrichum higginsianum IMI 349063]OBR08994.1 Glycosyl hydrolase family 92 [Colletotrichum higginsianum IMI 349063]